jgi:hypothetical protein
MPLVAAHPPGAGGPGTVQADQTIGSVDDTLEDEMTDPVLGLNDDVTGTAIPPP